MKKALFVANVFNFIHQFERDDIKILIKKGYEIHVASNMTIPGYWGDHGQLDDLPIIKHNIPFHRSPFSIDNIKAYTILKKHIDENQYSIIHCHTPIGGFVTRLAARKSRILYGSKVIYTAHGFHFFQGASIKNWIRCFPAEWLCSFFTDILICINTEDYSFAKEHLHPQSVQYIPGVGIHLEALKKKQLQENIREKYHIDEDTIVLLSVGELIPRKNHLLVIDALQKLGRKDVKYIICGDGVLRDHIEKRIAQQEMQGEILLAGFCNNVFDYYSIADIFVFPSLQEGLPVALMEAMACHLPCLVSHIRGNTDLLSQKEVFFSPKKDASLIQVLKPLLANKELRVMLGNTNSELIKKFDSQIVKRGMRAIYAKTEQKGSPLSVKLPQLDRNVRHPLPSR
ncbi:glycosyltransferase [Sphaerochaeta pleomorpha str. Grapes]|uniref:Glycosyltransferase n=1 Tax=Sphaerochaeta pleomorpha (strain ATCC BAA-1885 / DSM 22778 / Grapes) TaxID=158190 RepID=G8QW92_SPHPG|nr:glycosyltransferase [Sphaerochaeta pleomorpha]AEV29390.1 glycosyltransferase [Sphaerochaeta pleomorpha str. Grapes]